MGAVTGDHVFLNTVTSARMKPPMPPTARSGIAASGERVKRFQLQAAVATTQINRMPALLTVPETVMVSPNAVLSARNTSPDKAGLDVFSIAIENLLNALS